jgi:hypothetical protein
MVEKTVELLVDKKELYLEMLKEQYSDGKMVASSEMKPVSSSVKLMVVQRVAHLDIWSVYQSA